MAREMEPSEAVTSEQFNQALRQESDRTAPHGFDWRRPYTEAEEAEAQAAKQRADERFAAEWTADVTAERRAAWNTLIRSGRLNDAKGKVHPLSLRQQEDTQGWTFEDLKRAVAQHGS